MGFLDKILGKKSTVFGELGKLEEIKQVERISVDGKEMEVVLEDTFQTSNISLHLKDFNVSALYSPKPPKSAKVTSFSFNRSYTGENAFGTINGKVVAAPDVDVKPSIHVSFPNAEVRLRFLFTCIDPGTGKPISIEVLSKPVSMSLAKLGALSKLAMFV